MSGGRYLITVNERLRELPAEGMAPWLMGTGDAADADEVEFLLGRFSVVLQVQPPDYTGSIFVVMINERERRLPAPWVVWWVTGVADFHRRGELLNALDRTEPADTQRMQALQIAEHAGWLEYRYVNHPTTRD